MTRAMTRLGLAVAVVCLTAVVSQAQQSATSIENKTFEILTVDGNHLVVRLPEGTRELTVSDDFRFVINGKPMSVRELTPGMKGTATVTTRTTVTPVTVTEVKNGTVMQATGSSIIVRTDEGIKSFTQGDVDKRGVKIMRNGRPATVNDFRQGDQLSATIITSMPPRVLTEKEVQATLAGSKSAGAAGAAGGAASVTGSRSGSAVGSAPSTSTGTSAGGAQGQQAASQSAGAARTLPKTASAWPLLGLVSLLSLATGLGLTMRRRFVR